MVCMVCPLPYCTEFMVQFFHWTSFTNKTFNGLEKYLTLTSDKVFWAALFHNLIWAGLTLAFPLLIGLILSSLLFRSKYRVFSSIYYLHYRSSGCIRNYVGMDL